MEDIKDLIENIINPPGLLKKNRRAIFDTIRDIGELVRKDAFSAFNAHFPYLADSKKLQEHGDALLIPRLLHDSEAEYRERVATASFFLMKAGERQYIMGQLEGRFKSRYMIIEAFLNIHLKVSDLTDDERAWALELLDSLLNPVIYTELSEWFHYIDEVIITDSALYNAARQDIDFFDDTILRDGSILRDGKTAFNKTIIMLRNGVWKRNGRYGRAGLYTFPDTAAARLSRGNGYRDTLATVVKKPMSDTQFGSPDRDGTRKRDGSFRRGYYTAFEEMPPFKFINTEREIFPADDQYPTRILKNMSDTHKGSILRDGSRRRNGILQRTNIVDEAYLTYGLPMIEAARHKIWRDGKTQRDGSGERTGLGRESIFEQTGEAYTITPLVENETINENAQAVIINDFSETHVNGIRRNGTYRRDGLLQRANIQDTAGIKYRTAAVVETAQYRVARNGMMRRDGSETRSGFGPSSIYESGRAVITLPVEKDVLEARDADMQSVLTNYTNDIFKNERKRDGTFTRDGRTRRSNFIIDAFRVNYAVSTMRETASIDELFSVGARKHLLRAGMYLRDGSVQRNNNVLVPLAE